MKYKLLSLLWVDRLPAYPFQPGSLLITGIVILLMLTACSKQEKSESEPQPGRELNYTQQITFLDHQGDSIVTINAAVADEESERNTGLMDVNTLPQDKGMLFIFEEQQPLNFWMANTPLSLDIIFISNEREIVRIHHSTQPFTEKNFSSDVPAKYVVETNGGFCISHDIREGMQVEWQEN